MKNEIIAIFLATLMVLTVFASFAIPACAVKGGVKNDITFGTNNSVLIGQTLGFTVSGQTIVGLTPDAIKGLTFSTTSDNYDSTMLQVGTYNCSGDVSGIADLLVSAPILNIDIVYDTTSISSTTAGTSVIFKTITNIPNDDIVNIEIRDPDGDVLGIDGDKQVLRNVPISYIRNFNLNTTGFKIGVYTIQIKTNLDEAEGLNYESNVKTLEIISSDITLKVSKMSVVKGEKTTLTISAPAGNTIHVITTPVDKNTIVLNYNDIGISLPAGDNNNVLITTKSDSTFKLTMKFSDTGTYTVTAKDVNTEKSTTIDIIVSDAIVSVNAPTISTIGEKVKITGTVTGYDGVTIVIKDNSDTVIIWDYDTKDSSGNYEYNWDTKSMLPGIYRINIYASDVKLSSLTSVSAITSIRLTEGDLVVNIPSSISESDSLNLKVEGIATGVDTVSLFVVNNANSEIIQNKILNVDLNNKFEQKMNQELSTGKYTVFVVHPGRDMTTEVDVSKDYSGKTIAQITSHIEYFATIAGSDDILEIREFEVKKDIVTILPIGDVSVTSTLTVEATTNRAEDKFTSITLIGPDDSLIIVTTKVVDSKIATEFDTTNFAIGTWEIEVDVDGTVKTATFNIVATTPSPTVTPTVIPTITPTVTPTPGFETVFAIAGLLAVAYLVLRREE